MSQIKGLKLALTDVRSINLPGVAYFVLIDHPR